MFKLLRMYVCAYVHIHMYVCMYSYKYEIEQMKQREAAIRELAALAEQRLRRQRLHTRNRKTNKQKLCGPR